MDTFLHGLMPTVEVQEVSRCKGACLQGSWSTALRIQHICSLGIKNVSLFARIFPLLVWIGAGILEKRIEVYRIFLGRRGFVNV